MGQMLMLFSMLSLLDPSATAVVIDESPHGILFTDGRRTGLHIDTGTDLHLSVSHVPGAGGNVVVSGEYLIFKECPAGEFQRIVRWSDTGGRDVLLEEEFFSGPFPGINGSFMAAVPGRIIEYDPCGEAVNSWETGSYPAMAASVGDAVYYTPEYGGIGIVSRTTGLKSHIQVPGDDHFRSLTAGPGDLLLAERGSSGFIVIDGSGGLILDVSEGLFPTWTSSGQVLFSVLEYRGLEPVSGDIRILDPLSGLVSIEETGGIPLHPFELETGRLLWTDGGTGQVTGADLFLIGEELPRGPADDPDAHFDVVYMHQRWDTPDWFNGSWSCGPTSCLMTTQYYLRLTPDSIWASSPSPGHWSLWGNYVPVEYTFLGYTYDDLGESPSGLVPGAHGFICPDGGAWWNLMVEFLTRHGIWSAWAGTSWSTLTGEIDNFYPVVCSSNVLGYGHIILLNGYYENHTVVVNDPFGDANQSGWGSYYNGKDVLYDWPGYNNGNVEIGVSQLFYAQAPIPADPDTLVDDCSRGFFKFGDCMYWHMTGSGFGGNGWWTYSTAAPPDTCIANWYPVLPGAGEYEILVHIPPDHSEATGIYHLMADTGFVEILLDQESFSDEWASLGIHSLDTDAFLRLGDYTGTGGEHIAFDAALFRLSTSGTDPSGQPVDEGLSIWPNPVQGILSFSSPALSGPVSITVYDISGRTVLESSGETSDGICNLDVSSLRSGVYLVRVTDSSLNSIECTRMITVLP